MILRGLIAGATLGTKRLTLQVRIRAKEVAKSVEAFLPYGMSALPPASNSGDVALLPIGIGRDHQVAIFDDWSLRIGDLAEGEFGFQNARGTLVVFRNDRLQIFATDPVEITGNVKIIGNLTVTEDVLIGPSGSAKKIALDGDPVSGGVVNASATQAKAN